MPWYLIAAAVITLVVSIFAVQNSQPVTLKFILWDLPSKSLVLIILFSAATGVLVTLLFSVARQVRLNMQIRELQARIRHMEPPKSPPGGNASPS